jgi:DNA-binding transcriptional ArsR family regulator
MENLDKKLKILGDENRFKIIKLLLSQDLCVGALAHHLGVSKPAISQHMQVLRKAGLVKGEKRGYWTHYAVEKDILRQIAEELIDMSEQPDHSCTEGPCDHFQGIQDKPNV